MTKILAAVWAIALITAMSVFAQEGKVLDSASRREGVSPSADMQPLVNSPGDLQWIPQWRERSDCGRLALFVLMKLQGEQVTMDDVKRLTPLDPIRGCSMADLNQAAEKLGMHTEMRFVNPRDLSKVPCPFIVHGASSIERGLGHFAVVVAHEPKTGQYAVIDPIFERLAWYRESSLLKGYSGYLLLPMNPASQEWDRLTGYSLLFGGIGILSFWLLHWRRWHMQMESQRVVNS